MFEEVPASGQSTRDAIQAVLVNQFGESGARYTDWLDATTALLNVSKPTFDRHKRDLVKLCITVKKDDDKFYPVIPNDTDCVIPGDTNGDTKEESDTYRELSSSGEAVIPSDTSGDTSRGINVSPVSPPIGGNGDTNLIPSDETKLCEDSVGEKIAEFQETLSDG